MLSVPVSRVALAVTLLGGSVPIGRSVSSVSGDIPYIHREHPAHRLAGGDSTSLDSTGFVEIPRLTVRPKKMATGTRTLHAGAQLLDSLKRTWVYVPPQCVGTRRCPLVVVLGGAAISATEMISPGRPLAYRSPFADQYGMILLAPEATARRGMWDVLAGLSDGTTQGERRQWGMQVTQFQDRDVRNMDAALQRVLRQFAIDPDKIALEGFSNGGSYTLFVGRQNPQVFSRILGVSPVFPFVVTDPKNQTLQIFVSGGIAEGPQEIQYWLHTAQTLRQEGHKVEMVLGLRGHMDWEVDKEYEWQWLARSWGLPTSAPQSAPPTVADSDPVLTTEALAKMTTFWTRFVAEADSVLTEGRLTYRHSLSLAIGQQPVSVATTNMAALAAKYPSVAADLQAAGLTARQEDADRAAILRVGITRLAGPMAGPIPATSVLGQNLAFREAHDREFKALSKTGMWLTP